MHLFIGPLLIVLLAFPLSPVGATAYVPGSGWQSLTWTNSIHNEFNNEGGFTFSVTEGQKLYLIVTEAGWNGEIVEVFNQGVFVGLRTSFVSPVCAVWTDQFDDAASSNSWGIRIVELFPADYDLTFQLKERCHTAGIPPDTWIAAFKVMPNVAPTVNAGSAQTLTLPSAASLDGTVTDDGLPGGPVTTTWSQISGPGTVTFFNEFEVDTTARFSTPGEYVLRLTATDGDLTNDDDVVVTVNPVPPNVNVEQFFEYELWIQAQTSLDLGPVTIEGRIVNTGTVALKAPLEVLYGARPGNGLTEVSSYGSLLDALNGRLEPGESRSFVWFTGTITQDISSWAGEKFRAYLSSVPFDSLWRWSISGSQPDVFLQSQWVTGPADTSLPFYKKTYNLETYGQLIVIPPMPPDFNDDDKADILWRNMQTGTVALWLMNGPTISSYGFLGGVPAEWKIEGIGDVNGDGKADVIWQNSNGVVAIWLMNGLTMNSVAFPGRVSSEWKINQVGDISGDGRADLVWRNTSSGQVAVWLMNGGSIAKSAFLPGVPLNWKIIDLGDMNGDHKEDLIWHNNRSGYLAVWLMDGGTISSVEFPGGRSLDWEIKGVGDVNNDGTPDLFLRNLASHIVAITLMKGPAMGLTSLLNVGVPASWKISQIADANGDGRADVVWQHTNGSVAVWLMNGTEIQAAGFPGGVSPAWKIQP
ncbi:MAG: FG-GAP-like repeat-containing protein [Nitrospirales bacterium]|nr:FG-GAP-like repeat-containing protein [Nitrospirales bacterium]